MKKWWWTLPIAGVAAGAIALAIVVLNDENALQVSEVTISGDPRILVVTYMASAPPCDTPTRVRVDESESTVTLRAWEKKGPSGACLAVGRLLTAEVELDEPLGEREVVDGRDGLPVVVKGSPDRG